MGSLSVTSLLTRGGLRAGDDTLAAELLFALQAWLRKEAKAWPWPVLVRKATGIVLASGAQSLSIGAGAGGITPAIMEIRAPIWIYNTAKTVRTRANIIQLFNQDVNLDETVNDATTNIGIPTSFKVRADSSTLNKWSLIPNPVPDRSLLLSFDYLELPADPATVDIPWYPNDETIIHAIKTFALEYGDGGDEWLKNLEILASRVVDDRNRWGTVPGTNDLSGLDSSIFK